MLELFTIEQLEQELQNLYAELKKVKDEKEKHHNQMNLLTILDWGLIFMNNLKNKNLLDVQRVYRIQGRYECIQERNKRRHPGSK